MSGTDEARQYWTPTSADAPRVSAVAEHYWASASAPHRAWAVASVNRLHHVQSVLDLGCQCGPNLRALQACRPDLALTGIDVNAAALAIGRARLPTSTFLEGVIPEALATFPTCSIDVVLSTYCLAYQGPDCILVALAECLRIARVGVVLIEPMSEVSVESRTDRNAYVEWRYNYADCVREIVNDSSWPSGWGVTVSHYPMPPYRALTGPLVLTATSTQVH